MMGRNGTLHINLQYILSGDTTMYCMLMLNIFIFLIQIYHCVSTQFNYEVELIIIYFKSTIKLKL